MKVSCCRDEELDVAGKGINNHNTMKWVWYLVGVVKLWVVVLSLKLVSKSWQL